MDIIDLRSDTVTQPTPEMRAAMAAAPVGDDVYGEDPTVNRLQEMAAALLGKQAGLFVPSGTMGNLAAVLVHCGRGDEVILGKLSHTFLYEAGGISALGGVHSSQLANQADGSLDLAEVSAAIRRENDPHLPTTRLICIENTHNRCGGAVVPLAYTRRLGELARNHGLAMHLDGARIFNAAAALEKPARELAADFDSVTFCLSKALCAPVGSVLCGSRDFVDRARRIRKQLGGGMRQAGILAAAGLVALETMPARLGQDHARARSLAEGLSRVPGLTLNPPVPATNMVFLDLSADAPQDAAALAGRLKARGVLVGVTGERRFRLVTHYWISDEHVRRTVEAFREALA